MAIPSISAASFAGLRARIGFVQNNRRPRARFPALRQISFDAPHVEIAVQRRHDQRNINIRHDHLLRDLFPGNFAHKSAASRQNVLNQRVLFARREAPPRPSRRRPANLRRPRILCEICRKAPPSTLQNLPPRATNRVAAKQRAPVRTLPSPLRATALQNTHPNLNPGLTLENPPAARKQQCACAPEKFRQRNTAVRSLERSS